MDINFKIEKDKLSSDITNPFSGNVNYYHCAFTFSDEWADLTKYAVFMVEDKAYTVEIIDDACIMPKEVLYKRCHVTAGVFGTNGASSDYIRISTNPICFFVNDGSYVDGETPEQPTPDIWEIYLQKVQNAANNAVPYIGSDDYWYVYDADIQSYAKTNILAKGQKGDKGDTGYTPIKGVDYFTSADIESLGIDQKQDKLTFDDTPTADSTNPVTSRGVKTALDEKADKTEVSANDNALKDVIAALKEKSVPHTTLSGYPVSASDHLSGEAVLDYKVYGNSVQDGTPTPDTPVEIQSVGDLVTDTASEYYGKYDVPITVCGKNLFDISVSEGFTSQYTGLTNTISENTITLSSTTNRTGYLTLGTFEAGTYYIGITSKDYIGEWAIRVDDMITANKVNATITITQKRVIKVQISLKPGETKHFTNIQVTKSDVATEYEPYIGEIKHIYLDEPLRKVGDYADYIDFKNQKVMRNILKQSLKVNDIYKKLNGVIRLGGFISIDIKHKRDTHILSTIFNYDFNWYGDTECIFHHNEDYYALYWSVYWSRLGLTYDGTNVFRTDDAEQTPLTDKEIIKIAKEWLSTLSDEDKEIYVILNTPTEESITAPELSVPNSASMNVISEAATQPSSIDLTYWQDINKVLTNLTNAILAQGGNV